jgi:EAL domain-containing protein (putative c-di-GMP-specific phosphodiesterase class I)
MFPPEVFARYYDEIRPALLRAGAWHGELPVFAESGESVPMMMTIVASVAPGGEIDGLVTSGRVIEASGDPTPVDTSSDSDASRDALASALADELAVAVSHGLIQPHIQPVFDLDRGTIVGFQGLARWERPHREILEAEQFVDIVANTPVLAVVDLAVLRRTAAAAARAARGGRHVRAYGHVSQRLLSDVGLVRYLAEIIDDLRVEPSDLCVEIAHSLVARPSERIARALRDLHAIGIGMVLSAVDGECDVNRIVEYGFDQLRLSRSLVRDAAHDATRHRVAKATVALARALGLGVIAVGVETEAERVTMRDAGCDYAQGNLFGPVQPAGAIS